MKKSALPVLFSLIMIFCVLFLIWYLPAVGQLRFDLSDTQKSLETSLGRERKQQYEYDETVAAIPVTEAELERLAPLVESAQKEVKELKKERKKLRNEKKKLESEKSSCTVSGTGAELFVCSG